MKYAYFLILFCFISKTGTAQQTNMILDEVEIPAKLLPYSNPVTDTRDPAVVEEKARSVDENEKEILSRVADAYRIHVLSIDAQVQGDLVQAETYINDSFRTIQMLMDDFPEVQNNRRFTELYRSVMAEHQEFYGISEPMNKEEGEVFAIQEEL